MPSPNPNESQDDFIGRCMGDSEAQADFPDQDQRLAFCHSQWQNRSETMEVEHRSYQEIEIRESDDGRKIVGYAAVFDHESEPLAGKFREVIRPGAFTRALDGDRDVVALVEHDGQPIGRRSAGTLQVAQDARGLRVEITPPDTTLGRDTVALIKRGDYNAMSFGFKVGRNGQSWRKDDAGGRLRELRDIDELVDVSIVNFPAYRATEVALRHMAAAEAEDVEDWAQTERRRIALAESEVRD